MKATQLVGRQQVFGPEDSYEDQLRFYGDLFASLTQEVKHTGDLTRYVGYQSRSGERCLHFLGIEVERIQDLPEGMIAWDLSDSTRTVWESRDGRAVPVVQDTIEWRWLDGAPAPGKRYTGEFATFRSAQPGHGGATDVGEFWISANAYVGLREGDVSDDRIYLSDHDPSWPQQFEAFADWLQGYLGPETAQRIEHYGSTAIPGMPAKPIIDVLVQVPSFAEAKRRAVPLLNSETCDYWWHSEHMVFVKREELMGKRTHHVHMAPQSHRVWDNLAFRDYLRSHPEEASHYAALKRELAAGYREDRERYTEAKSAFVSRVTAEALAQRSGEVKRRP